MEFVVNLKKNLLRSENGYSGCVCASLTGMRLISPKKFRTQDPLTDHVTRKESTVTNLTRRSLLQNAPLTAATLSVLPPVPALAASRLPPEAAAPRSASGTGSMVIHVNDVATGEMTLLVGAREVCFRDPGLVAYFIKAAR